MNIKNKPARIYSMSSGRLPIADKTNCWEFKKCGREPDGVKVSESGICPAAAEVGANGTNSGKNAGRACWTIAGTFCGGKVRGTFAEKVKNCANCEFYLRVAKEEGIDLKKPVSNVINRYRAV